MEYIYEKHQLVEVICQLRFPTILSIESKAPADFQDTIRQNFPRYVLREEKLPGGNTVKNHAFISADGAYKLSLTQSFIALSTVKYRSWADFASALDEPLGQFIRLYRPAYFERIGIRYVNAVSREALELEDCPWRELIAPEYLGPLAGAGVDERAFTKLAQDSEQRLPSGDVCKLHAGPGLIQRNVTTPQGVKQLRESKPRFIFDMDLYRAGELPLADAPATIDRLHGHADRIFSAAITDKLHEAMEPTYL